MRAPPTCDVLGVPDVARRLAISKARLKLYAEDLQRMPEVVFLRIIDILTDAEVRNLLEKQNALAIMATAKAVRPDVEWTYSQPDSNGTLTDLGSVSPLSSSSHWTAAS